ncbi:MAG: YdbH domain-containing protein [Candidatus Omnitrophica bacterium]|nr:YdbH domain-containing protein [Candidatus Omnitrophota bacterium]
MCPNSHAELNFSNVDLARVTEDFNMEEKLQMTGKMGGRLTLNSQCLDIKILDGSLVADRAGGELVIKDMRFLENMSGQSHEPMDIMIESFKDYHYDTAVAGLSLEDDNLVADMALEGEKGKRSIKIILHEFQSK